ncbi:MAG: TolC family protein [Planctomycetota bacterium]|nr:TolC family protein [Planctomycetota bacterium]
MHRFSRSQKLVYLVFAAALLGTIRGTAQETLNADAAQPHTPVTTALTLNEATNLAIDASPEIKEITWRIQQAQADGLQESRPINPQVGAVVNEIGNQGQGGQYGFFLQRNVVRNSRAELTQNAYQWKAQSLQNRSKILQRQIAYQVAAEFIQSGSRQLCIQLAHAKINGLSKIRQMAESLMKGGEIAPIELNQVDIELEEVRQALSQFEIEKELARQLLLTYLGDHRELQLDFNFDQEVQLVLDSNPQRNHNIQQHPAIIQLDDQIQEYQWRHQLAQSNQTPDWKLQTAVNFDTATQNFFGGLQLNVPWQINHRFEGSIQSVASQVQALNEQKKLMTAKLQRKLIRLSAKRISLITRLNSINTRIIPLVDKNSIQLTRLFQAGETTYQKVMLAFLDRYHWRELKLQISKELLAVEVETETLPVD